MTSATGTLAKVLLERMPDRPVQLVPMTVAQASPQLRVYLNNETTVDVPARSLTGDGLAEGATGFAIWQPPLPPLVFTASDSGWINVTYAAGFTAGTPGQLQYRKIGNKVYMRGGATRAAGYTAGTQFIVNSPVLPAEFRPVTENVRKGSFGTGLRSGVAEIRTDGTIRLGSWDTSVLDWVACDVHYLTD